MRSLRQVLIPFTLFLFVVVAPALAQRPDKGDGQAIKNKLQDVLDKAQSVGDNLEALCDANCQATPIGQKFKNKVARLRAAQARVKAAHGRTKDADFQEFVRKRPKHKDDGCDDQVQVCIDSKSAALLSAQNEPEYDEEQGKDMIEDLDEVGSEIDELNQILSGNLPPPSPPDIRLDNAEYFFPASLRPSPELAYGAFIASQVAQKASAIASHGCDQTAVALGFGGNASAACIVVEGVFQLLDYVYQVMDYINQDVMSAEVTGTYKRAKNIFDQLSISDGNIDAIRLIVETMGQKLLILEENQKRILELLTMPQGLRPGFPKLP